MERGAVLLSVVVPVYNDQVALGRCLDALVASGPPRAEIVVVDDASTDESALVATREAVRLIRLADNVGPAAARNLGARQAHGDVLVFVDSDVVVAPGALDRVARLLDQRPDVAAVFGSYDASPPAPGIVSRYKNLQHHYVHQHGRAEASTFWAGLGAIRRRVFEEVGGFDAGRFRRPSIEDIELGYRVRRAGHLILLDPGLQGTHLKRWTFRSLVRTDVMGRAVPWARLILESGQPVDDLNLQHNQRASAGLVALATVCLVLSPFRTWLLPIAAAALSAEVALNRRLYAFFARRGGLGFALAAVLLHWLYYLYSGLAYAGVWASVRLGRTASRPSRTQNRADGRTGEPADGREM